MDREIAKDLMKINRGNSVIVDMIYDDFESRVCGNCEHIEQTCDILLAFNKSQAVALVNSNFGCNKFKVKGV